MQERRFPDLPSLVSLLGKPTTDPQVRALLREAGHLSVPRIPRDESGVYVNANEKGVSLLFEEADYFANAHDMQLQSDAPVLSAIFIYGPGHDEFEAYQGELVNGLRFEMGQPEVRAVLGKHALWDTEFNTEAWDIGERVRLFVDYVDDDRAAFNMLQAAFFTE